MSAHKTGLTHYIRDGKDVYADRITAMELIEKVQHIHELVNSKILWFGTRSADVGGKWINENNPQVGGWFVVEDVTPTKLHPSPHLATFVSDEDFNNNYIAGEPL